MYEYKTNIDVLIMYIVRAYSWQMFAKFSTIGTKVIVNSSSSSKGCSLQQLWILLPYTFLFSIIWINSSSILQICVPLFNLFFDGFTS